MSRDPAFKTRVHAALEARISADLAAVAWSQADSQSGATHAESRPEHAKDTRSVESSYLARGLAERVVELRKAADRLDGFEQRVFGWGEGVALSALVCLEDEEDALRRLYYLAPTGGGVKLSLEGEEITVVTPTSPIGAALLGRTVDDGIAYHTPKGRREATILWLI